ncbi:MAG: xanthine dehydrogenase family protein subunit M [Planctomycetota bacterium]|nr:MAG: xanthine dehydrogenase family protein subunit M [Planctomycetota bacterium]
MKAFELQNPVTLAEAARLLPTKEGDESARLLAGGQDLLTELKHHLVEPDRIVNLKHVPGLDAIEWGADGGLTIGALVTLQDLAEDERVRRELPILAEAAESVGSPQIRAMGTVGGNLNQRPRCWYYRNEHAVCLKKGGTECFAYEGRNKYNAILGGGPSYIVHPSDLAPALVALGAQLMLASPDGQRQVAAEDFFTLPSEGNVLRETVLAPNEILARIVVPPPASGMKSTYLKFQERSSYDFALSAVAVCIWMDGKKVKEVRMVLGAVAPKPWRVKRAEALLAGRELDADALKAVGEEALRGAEPLAENGYKVPLTKGLIVRALQKLS